MATAARRNLWAGFSHITQGSADYGCDEMKDALREVRSQFIACFGEQDPATEPAGLLAIESDGTPSMKLESAKLRWKNSGAIMSTSPMAVQANDIYFMIRHFHQTRKEQSSFHFSERDPICIVLLLFLVYQKWLCDITLPGHAEVEQARKWSRFASCVKSTPIEHRSAENSEDHVYWIFGNLVDQTATIQLHLELLAKEATLGDILEKIAQNGAMFVECVVESLPLALSKAKVPIRSYFDVFFLDSSEVFDAWRTAWAHLWQEMCLNSALTRLFNARELMMHSKRLPEGDTKNIQNRARETLDNPKDQVSDILIAWLLRSTPRPDERWGINERQRREFVCMLVSMHRAVIAIAELLQCFREAALVAKTVGELSVSGSALGRNVVKFLCQSLESSMTALWEAGQRVASDPGLSNFHRCDPDRESDPWHSNFETFVEHWKALQSWRSAIGNNIQTALNSASERNRNDRVDQAAKRLNSCVTMLQSVYERTMLPNRDAALNMFKAVRAGHFVEEDTTVESARENEYSSIVAPISTVASPSIIALRGHASSRKTNIGCIALGAAVTVPCGTEHHSFAVWNATTIAVASREAEFASTVRFVNPMGMCEVALDRDHVLDLRFVVEDTLIAFDGKACWLCQRTSRHTLIVVWMIAASRLACVPSLFSKAVLTTDYLIFPPPSDEPSTPLRMSPRNAPVTALSLVGSWGGCRALSSKRVASAKAIDVRITACATHVVILEDPPKGGAASDRSSLTYFCHDSHGTSAWEGAKISLPSLTDVAGFDEVDGHQDAGRFVLTARWASGLVLERWDVETMLIVWRITLSNVLPGCGRLQILCTTRGAVVACNGPSFWAVASHQVGVTDKTAAEPVWTAQNVTFRNDRCVVDESSPAPTPTVRNQQISVHVGDSRLVVSRTHWLGAVRGLEVSSCAITHSAWS